MFAHIRAPVVQPPFVGRRTKSGNLAKLTAIRRASSLVGSLAADRRPGSSSQFHSDFGSAGLNATSCCHGSVLYSGGSIPREIYSDSRSVVYVPAEFTTRTPLIRGEPLVPTKYKPRYVTAMTGKPTGDGTYDQPNDECLCVHVSPHLLARKKPCSDGFFYVRFFDGPGRRETATIAPSAMTPKTIAPSSRVAAIGLFGLGANIGLL